MSRWWRAVPGWEGLYDVNRFGDVRDLRNGGRLLPHLRHWRGYLRVELYRVPGKKATRKNMRVHRLVALAWIPNPAGKREVNHKDRDKTNNHRTNLEWTTRKENMQHARDTGFVARSPVRETSLSYRLKEDRYKLNAKAKKARKAAA